MRVVRHACQYPGDFCRFSSLLRRHHWLWRGPVQDVSASSGEGASAPRSCILETMGSGRTTSDWGRTGKSAPAPPTGAAPEAAAEDAGGWTGAGVGWRFLFLSRAEGTLTNLVQPILTAATAVTGAPPADRGDTVSWSESDSDDCTLAPDISSSISSSDPLSEPLSPSVARPGSA